MRTKKKLCVVLFSIVNFIKAEAAGSRTAEPQSSGTLKHFFVSYGLEGFDLSPIPGISFKPSCLKQNGINLIILDPGHDDSDAGRRSDARVRGESGGTRFLWPKIHEGQLNAAVAWMAFETILRDTHLTEADRDELRSMIRFTRYPGERSFGEYETSDSYYSATQGKIDAGVTNRRERANFMMQKHRVYQSSNPQRWSSTLSNMSDKTLFVSVHANSSDYFNEGDITWLIRPRTLAPGYAQFLNQMKKSFSRNMTLLTNIQPTDAQEVRSLKSGLRPSFSESAISTDVHPQNLRMLATELGSNRTLKMLTEGFVMNGKAGNLAKRQLEGESKKIKFYRKLSRVQTYLVSDVYIQYARSLAEGIGNSFGCR